MKWVLLDVDGVLLREQDLKHGLNNIFYELRIDPHLRKEFIKKYSNDLDLGHINFDFVYDLLLKDMQKRIADFNITKEQYYSTLFERAEFNKELVEYFVKNDIPVCVFTNNFEDNMVRIRKLTNMSDWAKKVLSSHEHRMKKPNRDFYDFALKELNAKPEECFFIDDREENVETAISMGLKGIVYRNNHETIHALSNWLKNE